MILSTKNADLAKELKSSLAAADIPLEHQSKLNSLADGLLQNQQEMSEKANHANVIVKDMLEHSGKTLGEDSLLI